ncbi:MAG: DUF1254 domain-containing protein [Pyrinomonadaceae bacterium]|nr:DUF1254 domain-containing protein [Pyrinomonadaceae bacterium]
MRTSAVETTGILIGILAWGCTGLQAQAPKSDPQWIGTETVKTPYGNFDFKNGYPTPAAAEALLDQLKFNRAIEVYLTQLTAVSIAAEHRGLADFGAKRPNQVIIWESLMDAKTILLTANTETVYALGHLDLKSDGPTVVEAPPKMLGFAMDALQRYLVDIGLVGPDKGAGGKYLFLPPGYTGDVPQGYFVAKSPTYTVGFGVRGFLVDGKTDQAVALMKQIKVYPLAKSGGGAPPMEFLNGSGQAINTVHPDTIVFFEMLAQLVNEEPAAIFSPIERFQMKAIGIEHGKPFNPDAKTRAMLSEAARTGSAIARANSFASPVADTYFYPDGKWQYAGFVPFNFMKDGVLEVDLRAYVYYMALGNSPAMTEKNIGVGSYYLWAYMDAAGEFLDGAKNYKLHIPANVPVKDFWSVLVYDSLSRSELQNSQKFPSVSKYSHPKINADGSVDIYFGPKMPPGQEKNWINTVPGKGWFPIFRFYGPLQPLYDKTWKLPDIEMVK